MYEEPMYEEPMYEEPMYEEQSQRKEPYQWQLYVVLIYVVRIEQSLDEDLSNLAFSEEDPFNLAYYEDPFRQAFVGQDLYSTGGEPADGEFTIADFGLDDFTFS